MGTERRGAHHDRQARPAPGAGRDLTRSRPLQPGLTVGEALANVRSAGALASRAGEVGSSLGVSPPLRGRRRSSNAGGTPGRQVMLAAVATRLADAARVLGGPTRPRGAHRSTRPRGPHRPTPGRGWRRVTGWKAIAVGVVVTPVVLVAVMIVADALGLHGDSHPALSSGATTTGTRGAAVVGRQPAAAPHRRSGGSPAPLTISTTAPGAASTTTTAPARPGGSKGASGPHGTGGPDQAGTRAATAAGQGAGGPGAPTSTSTTAPGAPTTTTTTPTTTTTTAPAPSPVAAWRVQNGAMLTTLQADVAAVQTATPSPSGDYTALVAPWQQLAADVAAAQGLPAIPDAATETTWSAALNELATATADWLASLSSTSPPGGTVADQGTFSAGTTQFTQGVLDLGSVATAVGAA